MPINQGKDNKGLYLQYGNTGKKYYFKSSDEKMKAYEKVIKQMKAIHSNK